MRAEKKKLEQKVQQLVNFVTSTPALTAAVNINSSSSSGCPSRMDAAVDSASSKSLQRLATERLFHPASHDNTTEMTSLLSELGFDSCDMDSAEAMLIYMSKSSLERLSQCLKQAPQGLFKQAFLPTAR